MSLLNGYQSAPVTSDALLSDRARFHAFVYTPFEKAMKELSRRRMNRRLREVSHRILSNDIPEPFREQPRLTLLRFITTPNHETRRFLEITKNRATTPPLLCEYPQDKFVPSNTSKRLLGKLAFTSDDTSMDAPAERHSVIDFKKSQNRKISEIATLWGQPLVSFHHEMFRQAFPDSARNHLHDISSWYHRHGPTAKQYYSNLLTLFVRDGILFENFIVDQKEEGEFFKAIVLPAFLEVLRRTGVKPLIVPLEPPESEGNRYWLSYPAREKVFVGGLVETMRNYGS